MGKLPFIVLITLTFCSCSNNDAGFDSNYKKEIMDSWAWKIFIFTDEGEFTPAETTQNKFDNTSNVSPIFVADFFGIYNKEDLFFGESKRSIQ